mmetsp:Transcript_32384/g.39204  ORF Transcript_32384/g.39204 Transcript_32384/m.39204 type:complete len:251 (-) Transcript_32384:1279-2031(-)|eukprot:CAMPEP_0197847862 /NCGR_PEP_ID=MMETSP1438-20131217/7329_1 /TAXON_ID=1461541 /ORGANISM="Pterosperma sp., Strain CCMP1384" /LENGTH=250 /DNA_ID=CAMNT_0043459915 /DNA_START=289 /DNA_END=1041 /DNA_ORIENTATION=+
MEIFSVLCPVLGVEASNKVACSSKIVSAKPRCDASRRRLLRRIAGTASFIGVALPTGAASAKTCSCVSARDFKPECLSLRNNVTDAQKRCEPSALCKPPRVERRLFNTELLAVPQNTRPGRPRRRRRQGGDDDDGNDDGGGGDGGDDGRGGEGGNNGWSGDGEGPGEGEDIWIWHAMSLISLAYCIWHVVSLEIQTKLGGSQGVKVFASCSASVPPPGVHHEVVALHQTSNVTPPPLRRCAWPLHHVTFH